MRSSAIFLVSVVTSTRSSRSARVRISPIRSSIWPLVGLTTTCGSTSPVGPDHLLDELAAGLAELVGPRRRRQVHRLPDPVGELLPGQRPVVDRRRQPEPEVDQVALAGHVALVHAADLRHGDVRLVDDHQEVFGEVVEQRGRRGARRAGRRCAASSSRCPSRTRPAASSRRRSWCASAAAAPPAACPGLPARPAAPPVPARWWRSRAPSAPARRRSAWPGRSAASRPCGPRHRSAGACSTAPRSRRRSTRCGPPAPRRTG